MTSLNRRGTAVAVVLLLASSGAALAGGEHCAEKHTQASYDEMAKKYASHGYLGIETEKNAAGAYAISKIAPGSPAEKAGLQPFRRGNRGEVLGGDVITAIDEQAVADLDDLLSQLERHQPGDSVTLTVWRSGQSRKQGLVLAQPE